MNFMKDLYIAYTYSDMKGINYKGVELINCTPHPVVFRTADGKEFTVPPAGCKLNASAKEQKLKEINGIEIVETVFTPSEEGLKELEEIRKEMQGKRYLILSSAISLNAYRNYDENVVMMTPAKGFERVPPEQKRMNPDKFSR